VITPSALSIVMTTFDEGAERNKALGIWGALGGGGAAVGVIAGGVLTTYLSWRWISSSTSRSASLLSSSRRGSSARAVPT
jgi:MFS family permease